MAAMDLTGCLRKALSMMAADATVVVSVTSLGLRRAKAWSIARLSCKTREKYPVSVTLSDVTRTRLERYPVSVTPSDVTHSPQKEEVSCSPRRPRLFQFCGGSLPGQVRCQPKVLSCPVLSPRVPSAMPQHVIKRVGPYDLLAPPIGHGSFATVYRAAHRQTNQTLAVKAVLRKRLNKKLMTNLEAEIHILQRLDHPNVVALHDVQTTENNIYIVMEFCPGGDLHTLIKHNGPQSELQAQRYMSQLANGIRYLRLHNLVHRDLKPQNLLLTTLQPDAVLKIADFGFARYVQQQDMAETLCGSPLYMAPEILRSHKYDAKADLWSVGTILHELITGKPPYSGSNQVQLLRHVDEVEVSAPPHVSSICAHLLLNLLKRAPTERLSFEAFFAHPFFTDAPPQQEAPLTPAHGGRGGEKEGKGQQADTNKRMGKGDHLSRPQNDASHAPEVKIVNKPCVEKSGPLSKQEGRGEANSSANSMRASPPTGSNNLISMMGGCVSPTPTMSSRGGAMERSRDGQTQTPQKKSHKELSGNGVMHNETAQCRDTSPTAALLSSSPPNYQSVPSLSPQLPPALASPMFPTYLGFAPSLPPELPLSAMGDAVRPKSVVATANSTASPALLKTGAIETAMHLPSRSSPSVGLPTGFNVTLISELASPGISAVQDSSLDGLDNEYVLVTTNSNTNPNVRRSVGGECSRSSGNMTCATSSNARPSPHGSDSAKQPTSTISVKATPASEKEVSHGLLAARAFAVAELAELALQGGIGLHGEAFTPVEAFALHVKALDLIRNAMRQHQPHTAPVTVSQNSAFAASSSEEVVNELRTRFSSLLLNAEHIRARLRSEPITVHAGSQSASLDASQRSPRGSQLSLSSSQRSPSCAHDRFSPATVCVEELLYRLALGMGREAALDELLGKLQSSRAMYERAQLLLTQLAMEPDVGEEDRAVLAKYAAGFSWRLHETAQQLERESNLRAQLDA